MTRIRATPQNLGRRLKSEITRRLCEARLDQLLVSQAKRRMDNGGDSTHHYPEVWDHPKSFRRGGQPLLDTRTHIYNRLTSRCEVSGTIVRLILVGPLLALWHQEGFTTKGPNFIPLTRKARRNASMFKRLMRARSEAVQFLRAASGTPRAIFALRQLRRADQALEDAGFIEGETYVMAWRGVTVPQRKVFNLPPEDIDELKREIARVAA